MNKRKEEAACREDEGERGEGETYPRGRPNGRAGHCTRLCECERDSLQLHRGSPCKGSRRGAPVQCPT